MASIEIVDSLQTPPLCGSCGAGIKANRGCQPTAEIQGRQCFKNQPWVDTHGSPGQGRGSGYKYEWPPAIAIKSINADVYVVSDALAINMNGLRPLIENGCVCVSCGAGYKYEWPPAIERTCDESSSHRRYVAPEEPHIYSDGRRPSKDKINPRFYFVAPEEPHIYSDSRRPSNEKRGFAQTPPENSPLWCRLPSLHAVLVTPKLIQN